MRRAYLGHHTAQGMWTPWDTRLHINILELWAVHLMWKDFLLLIRSLHVQLLSDNIMAVVYINKHGGTGSPSLCFKSVRLWNWCIQNQLMLQAVYLPCFQNSLDDTLSRTFYLNHGWELQCYSQQPLHKWGNPSVGPLCHSWE